MAVRPELHGVAERESAGEHDRVAAVREEFQQAAVVASISLTKRRSPTQVMPLGLVTASARRGCTRRRGRGRHTPAGHQVGDVPIELSAPKVRSSGDWIGAVHRYDHVDVAGSRVDGADLPGEELGDVQPAVSRAERDTVGTPGTGWAGSGGPPAGAGW